MKLRYSPTSPYVRKVAVAAIEAGLDGRIERIETDVWDPATDIAEDNPLGKVPALVTDEGTVLCDSPTICDYLDSLHDGPRLVPAEGPGRWQVLNLHALASGIMDAAVARVVEVRARPEALRFDGWLQRQTLKIARALDALEGRAAAGSLDVVSIGDTGSLILTIADTRITDGPGADFVVFENAFFNNGLVIKIRGCLIDDCA